MSEDDDWVIGEDFLDDFIPRNDPKESISDSSEKENPLQKKNPEPVPEKENSENEISESPEISQNSMALNLQDLQEEKTENSVLGNRTGNSSREEARINFINSILKRASKRNNHATEESETEKKSNPKILSRQNLLNSILKKSSERSQNTTPENEEQEISNISNPQDDNFRKPARNVSFSDESDDKEKRRKFVLDCLNKSKFNDDSKSKEDSRSKDLRNYFRPKDDSTSKNNESKNNESKNNESKNNSRSRNDSKSTSRTKQVIVRKFPGPAGLLPDNLDFSNFPMAYLNSFDESENERGLNESRISNFCSQNTKNLFTGGAWQSMIDDLPVDFFQGHEISTIKRNAIKGLYNNLKIISYMGAIIHHVDSTNIENTMVLLKDSTDEIEAIIHSDIWSLYPNSLEVGNVILLKNVRIINSKLYTYALIHPSTIVAIYNEKERFVTSETMEEILKDQEGNGEESRENCGERRRISFNSDLGINESFQKEKENSRKGCEEEKIEENQIQIDQELIRESRVLTENPGPAPKRQKVIDVETSPGPSKFRRELTPKKTKKNEKSKENENLTQIFDEEDDEAFMTLNLEEITASQGPKHIASSTLIGSQFSLEKNEKTPVKKRCDQRKLTPKKISTLQKLKQFRHKEDLTQPIIDQDERMEEEKRDENKTETSNFADLLDFEDEMDDEMSQMVIDPVPDRGEASRKEDEKIEKHEKNNSGTSNFSEFIGNDNHQFEEQMSQIDFSFNPEVFQDESITSRGSPAIQESHLQNLFEDPMDEILSQMNVDDF